jgi:hypothetical protein
MITVERFIYGLSIGLIFLLATLVWGQSTGDLAVYFSERVPEGQLLYILSKLTGLYAIGLLGLQVFIGITPSPGLKRYHRLTGYLLFLFIIIHAALFFYAASLRAGSIAYQILIPDFGSGFYQLAVSLGVVAVCLIPLVIVTGVYRQKKSLVAGWLHWISIVVCVLAFLHSYQIGSDTRSVVVTAFYLLIASGFVIALFYRAIFRFKNLRYSNL